MQILQRVLLFSHILDFDIHNRTIQLFIVRIEMNLSFRGAGVNIGWRRERWRLKDVAF